MSVTGYNVDPESGDAVCGIEMNPYSTDNHQEDKLGRPTATLYINEEEIRLTYEEVWALKGQAGEVKRRMEWAMAAWAYAKDSMREKSHILRRSDAMDTATALCGRKPYQFGVEITSEYGPRKWELDPLFQPLEKCPSFLCKRCFAAYRKAQGY